MRHFTIRPISPLILATLLLFSQLLFVAAPAHAEEVAKKKKVKKTAVAQTDDRSLSVVDKNRYGLKRVALVIGNGSYRHTDSMPKLANPANDADDMAVALRRFGFDVISKKNLTKEEMDETITDFGRKIADSDAALFYYAGHGLQVKGQNYMVPVDANIDSEAKVPYRAVNINQLLEEMDSSRSRVNIVMLDACRNNPISGKFRSGGGRGLAPPTSMPKGTVIVYATDPGNVAADGSGRNGLFTAGLLTAFKGSDLTLGGVLYAASKQVQNSSGHQQIPYINGPATLQREFSFIQPSSMTDLQPSSVQPQPLTPRVSAPQPATVYKKPAQQETSGLEMVNVPGGCFQMGDNFGDGASDEKPVHEACVSDFAIGKYEVTVGQFRSFVNATGYSTEAEKGDGCYVLTGGNWGKNASSNWKNPGFSQEDTHPVACVSWNDATVYSRWLSGQSGRSYRLPTGAEWEYAARSGGKREKYSGGDNVDAVAWYDKNSGSKTHPVGQKQANGLGLYDISGNVWEWVSDWYGNYTSGRQQNPQGPSSDSSRVIRGGSWSGDPRDVRASYRDFYVPGFRSGVMGFRLVAPVQ